MTGDKDGNPANGALRTRRSENSTFQWFCGVRALYQHFARCHEGFGPTREDGTPLIRTKNRELRFQWLEANCMADIEEEDIPSIVPRPTKAVGLPFKMNSKKQEEAENNDVVEEDDEL